MADMTWLNLSLSGDLMVMSAGGQAHTMVMKFFLDE